MTIQFNDEFYSIDRVYCKRYGTKWFEIIGEQKYIDVLNKYEMLSKDEKKAFDDGDLLF
jgi:hypothetical protein